MALTGYMRVMDANGNQIAGESTERDRENWIQVWGGHHSVRLPTANNGLPNGKRIHFPIEIIKEIDRTSPIFNQHLSSGMLLKEVVIDWYRINPKTSFAEAYFRQTLNDVQVNAVRFSMKQHASSPWGANPEHNMGHIEHVQFIYDDITWTILDGGVEYDDSQSTKPAPAKQAEKPEKPQKKNHLIHFDVKAEGDQPLPTKHKATIVVINTSKKSVVIKQPKDMMHEPESRQFKLEAGEEFKVYCVPPHLTTVLDDLRENGHLDQSESQDLIAPLEINGTETRQDDVTVHVAEYLIPDIKEFVFSA